MRGRMTGSWWRSLFYSWWLSLRRSSSGGDQESNHLIMAAPTTGRRIRATMDRPAERRRFIAGIVQIHIRTEDNEPRDQTVQADKRRPMERGRVPETASVWPRAGIEEAQPHILRPKAGGSDGRGL